MLHTPGPWVVDLEQEFTQGGDTVCVEALTEDRKFVTREICTLMLDTGENKDGDLWEECAANARLIAAAPSLLQQLISCKAALEWKSVVKALGVDDHANLYRRVCKAISDATQKP